MKIKERIAQMTKKKQLALAVTLAILFVGIFWGIGIFLVRIFEKLAIKIGFVLMSPRITGALVLCLTVGILWFILSMIFSKNKIDSIKDMANNVYDMLRMFGMHLGGLTIDFLLILFACMNFNKIVNIAGVHPEITTGALALGIFAISVRGIFRALQIGHLDHRIRKFLNTNEDVEYE